MERKTAAQVDQRQRAVVVVCVVSWEARVEGKGGVDSLRLVGGLRAGVRVLGEVTLSVCGEGEFFLEWLRGICLFVVVSGFSLCFVHQI